MTSGPISAWIGLGGDIVGLLPGGKLAAGALDGALASFRTVEGLTPALRAAGEGVQAAFPEFKAAAQQGSGAATWMAEKVAPAIDRVLPYLPSAVGGVADVPTVARGIESGLTLFLPQVPTANSLLSGDSNQAQKDLCAEWTMMKPVLDSSFGQLVDAIRAAA